MSEVQDWTLLPDDLGSLLLESTRSYSVRMWHPASGEPRDRDYENELAADYYRVARQHFDYYLTWPPAGERVWHAFNRHGEHAASIKTRQCGDFVKDVGIAARIFLLLRYLDEVRTDEAQPRKWEGFAGEISCCKLIVPHPVASSEQPFPSPSPARDGNERIGDMRNRDRAASPNDMEGPDNDGLTKRELAAIAAMQGILSDAQMLRLIRAAVEGTELERQKPYVKLAVAVADSLFDELDGEGK